MDVQEQLTAIFREVFDDEAMTFKNVGDLLSSISSKTRA
jgi:hypothetical protein